MDALILTGETTIKKNIVVSDEKCNDRLWEEIPCDILCEIYSRLVAGERVMFRSTCRPWNSVSPLLNISNLELAVPCLLHSNNRVFYPFYDKHGYMDFRRVPSLLILVAKDGWLLMEKNSLELIFYDPVTKSEVLLTRINNGYSMRTMYFSSPPISPDWFIVLAGRVVRGDNPYGIVITTIKSGDDDWRVCEFSGEDMFQFASCSPVVYEGKFYFLGEDARLLIHDPKSQENYFHDAPSSVANMRWETQCQSLYSEWEHYLLESDGQILAVLVGYDGMSVFIFRWNLSEKIWETVDSLEGKMLFVSRPYSVCVKATTLGTGNKIYFPRFVGSHGLFYSLYTQRFHTFTATAGTSYESYAGSKKAKQAFWYFRKVDDGSQPETSCSS